MKCKSKVKDHKLIMKTKLSSNQVISEREMDILCNQSIRGLLKPKFIRKKTLVYTGPSGVVMYEYLKNTLSKYEFFYIMIQIVNVTKKIQDNSLFLNNLILDLRYVFINENTKELQFIYLPVISTPLYLDVIRFMESISYALKATTDKNMDFIAKYVSFIKSLDGFNMQEIENYISGEDKDVARQIRKQNAGQSGSITNKQKAYYGYCEKNADTMLLTSNEMTSLPIEEDEATSLLEEGTTLLENYDTDVNYQNNHFASLVRVLTNETISINKPVFRIGKERSYVDYFVTNNNAISRSHADIITRGNRYFVCDQNAMNHTYINNELLAIKVETEIFEGDVLRLANEEFIFNM